MLVVGFLPRTFIYQWVHQTKVLHNAYNIPIFFLLRVWSWLSWKSVRLTYKRQWVPSPAEALEFYPEVNICTGPFRYLRRPDIKMPTSNDHLTAFHQSFWWLCQCTKFSVRMLGNIFLPLSQSQFRFSGCVEDDSRLVCIASLWEARYPALPGLAEGYI